MRRPVIRALLASAALMCVCTNLGDARADALDSEHSLVLGGHLGVVTGGGATPGGVELGGNFMYRLSNIDWFEGGLRVVIGSGQAACFTDRQGTKLCTHGPVAGRIGELSAGVRRYLLPQEAFTPYAQLRLGVRIATFPGDGVTGLGIPILAGFGVRGQINEMVAICGGATLEVGMSIYNDDLGIEPLASLSIQVGVEFSLD